MGSVARATRAESGDFTSRPPRSTRSSRTALIGRTFRISSRGAPLELHPSARKHFRRDRLKNLAVKYAAVHVLGSWSLGEGKEPRRWISVGVDPADRALKLVTLVYHDGSEVVIHASKAHQQYLENLGDWYGWRGR